MWKAEYLLTQIYGSVRIGRKYQAEIPNIRCILPKYEEKNTKIEDFPKRTSECKIQFIQPKQVSEDPVSFEIGPFYDTLYVFTCEDTHEDFCVVNASKIPISVFDVGHDKDISNETLEHFGYMIVKLVVKENKLDKFVHEGFFQNKTSNFEVITHVKKEMNPNTYYILIIKRKSNSLTVYLIYMTWKVLIYSNSKESPILLHSKMKQFLNERQIEISGLNDD